MGTGLILAILKRYWPFLVGAIVIGGAITYIKVLKMEVAHYKKEVVEAKAETKRVTLQFQKVVDDAENREIQLSSDNAELSERIASLNNENTKLIDQHTTDIKEQVKTNEELRKLKLSLDLIRLFNASKQPPGEHNEVVANSNPGNDGKAAATQEVTGTELFTIIAENDANHLKCIATVEKWQEFWKGYVANVERVRAQEP